MSRKTKIVFITVTLIILALALAGCGKTVEDTPWKWVQNLKSADIESAAFWCSPEYLNAGDDDNEITQAQEFKLDEKQLDKLFTILYRLEESNFSENTADADKTPLYGLKITMADGTEYNISRSEEAEGPFEMNYADKKWWIDSANLNEFIDTFLDNIIVEETEEDEYASEGDLEPTDLTEYASDGSIITHEQIDYSTYSDIG